MTAFVPATGTSTRFSRTAYRPRNVIVGPQAGESVFPKEGPLNIAIEVGESLKELREARRATIPLEAVRPKRYSRFGQRVAGVNQEAVVNCGIVILADYLADLIVLDVLDRTQSGFDLMMVVAGVAAAYVCTDLSSGFYNWIASNYGRRDTSAKTEISKSNARQQKKSTANPADQFFLNIGSSCLCTIPLLTILAGWHPENLGLQVFAVMSMSFMAILPQLNEWVSIEKPPPTIGLLQKIGLLRPRHDVPSQASDVPKDKYCLGGLWNTFLDGELVFRRLERVLYIASDGRLIPRVWKAHRHARSEAFAIAHRKPDDLVG